jgi:hypothetical protein
VRFHPRHQHSGASHPGRGLATPFLAWGFTSPPPLYRYRDLFLESGKADIASGAGKSDSRGRKIESLEKALEQRDQVIGELTIANRVFKKLSGEYP